MKKQKMILLKVKFKLNISGNGNVDIATASKILNMWPEELPEGELIDAKEECGCDKSNTSVLEEVMLAK